MFEHPFSFSVLSLPGHVSPENNKTNLFYHVSVVFCVLFLVKFIAYVGSPGAKPILTLGVTILAKFDKGFLDEVTQQISKQQAHKKFAQNSNL